MRKLAIIDDEKSICTPLEFALEDQFEIFTATHLRAVEDLIQNHELDVALLDLKFGEISGIEILKMIKREQPDCVVIVMTAYASVQTSIEALKNKAYDYLIKPVDTTKLRVITQNAADLKGLKERVLQLESEVQDVKLDNGIIGKSKSMVKVFNIIEKVKDIDTTVLITGNSGTGKELAAQAIHDKGKRKMKPFIPINCAALPEHLIESELFGYVKGAFTGATQSKKGVFERAHEGTLFLDEIGEMSLNMQTKVLRAIQEKRIAPLGSEQLVDIDIRLIAATNRDLLKMVKEGSFREDLYYRLNVVSFKLPNLKDRQDDILRLTQHFVKKYAKEFNKEGVTIHPEVLSLIEKYRFPGNVRELENLIERAVIFCDGSLITLNDLPENIVNTTDRNHTSQYFMGVKLGMTMAEIERKSIEATLDYVGGSRKETAKVLGISERSVRYKLKSYEHIE